MANLIIADLFQDGDFFEQLTPEELQMNVVGGATGQGWMWLLETLERRRSLASRTQVGRRIGRFD